MKANLLTWHSYLVSRGYYKLARRILKALILSHYTKDCSIFISYKDLEAEESQFTLFLMAYRSRITIQCRKKGHTYYLPLN